MQYFPLTPNQKLLERYHIKEEIGRGGRGAVYRAYDSNRNEEVALKLAKFVYADDEELSEIENEYSHLSKLSDVTGVPEVYELHTLDSGEKLLALELIRGKPLLSDEPYSLESACELLHKIVTILTEVHSRNICYGDLKLENILLNESTQTLTLLDFGSAKEISSNATSASEQKTEGTLYYMAPEQLVGRGNRTSKKSDIYSLGILFFILLTGKKPYENDALFSTRAERIRQFEKIITYNPKLPRWVKTFILTATCRLPALRYTSQEISELLKERAPKH